MVVGLRAEREHDGRVDEPEREHGPVRVVEAQQQRQRLALELARAGHAERELARREVAARLALPAQVEAHAADDSVGDGEVGAPTHLYGRGHP